MDFSKSTHIAILLISRPPINIDYGFEVDLTSYASNTPHMTYFQYSTDPNKLYVKLGDDLPIRFKFKRMCFVLEQQAVPVLCCPHHRDTLKPGCMGPSCFNTAPRHSDACITDRFGHWSITVPGKILPYVTTWMPHLFLLTYSPLLPATHITHLM